MVDEGLLSPALEELSRLHGDLLARAERLAPSDVSAVLNLGAAVVLHGFLERAYLQPRCPLLDSAVITEMAAEHDHLAAHLPLLDELFRAEPGSPDVGPLSAALLERLRAHLARDNRVFY